MLKGLNRRRVFLGVLILVLAAVLIWVSVASFAGSAAPAVKTVAVTKGAIENLVTATGSVQPRTYVDVGAQVSGQLKKLYVEVGDKVKKGDLLAEIDATVYAAKVDATRAQLSNQKALLNGRRADLLLAQSQLSRTENLYKAGAASKDSLEQAKNALINAKAQLAALNAQIEQTNSSLRESEANLQYASIYAPMKGTVVSISIKQGQTLNANQTAPVILQLADLSVMTVQAQVSEADVNKLYEKMPVYFTILGGEGKRWYSQLDKVEPTPQVLNNVVLYNALFEVPNDDNALMTQMTTQVFFIAASVKDVLLLPITAVTFDKGENQHKAHVQVLGKDGKLSTREVVVGINNRVLVEIKSGLALGDQVLAKPSVSKSTSSRMIPRGMMH